MKQPIKFICACGIAALIGLASHTAQAGTFKHDYDGDYSVPFHPFGEEERTANRTLTGTIVDPLDLSIKPENYAFTPAVSNWDAQNKHPQQWQGQDWDPTMWNDNWAPKKTLDRFFKARIFERQYMRKGKPPVPVLELGPKFFVLSDLDQRRTIKLLTDYTQVFGQGYPVVELRDWHTQELLGTDTPKGMFLN